jgi:hypothetical protein
MRRTFALSTIFAALFCCAAVSVGALDIEGNFLLGNLGITPSTATTLTGTDLFWGGRLSIRQDVTSNIQIQAALERDMIVGNSISAIVQYKSDYFRVGVGPYVGFLNSTANILNAGVSTLLGVEIPGVVFLTVQSAGSLGGLSSVFAQSNQVLLGFYIRDSAICSFGLLYQQFALAAPLLVEGLTAYSFDVKVFEKNVPYRLDFNFAYQQLDGMNSGGSLGLGSVIVGAGIDLLLTPSFALVLGFRTSVYTVGSGNLQGLLDIGFSPFLFQASAGFRVTLADAAPPSPGQ